MLSNRKIDAIILGSEFLIDFDYGIQALNKYLHELSLVEAGVSLKDLGYSNDPMMNISIINSNGSVSRPKDGIASDAIARITLNSVLRMEDGLSSAGMRSMGEKINELKANPNIQGFLFDVNSGGGEATAGIHLYNIVKELNKPSVAIAHMMASATYLAMLPVTEMVALSTISKIGSIGTMMSIDKKMIEEFKANYIDIYASKSPNKNEEARQFIDSGDISKFVTWLDKVNNEFHAKVLAYRDLNPDTKTESLSGRLFLAKEAKANGLIDSIGTEDYAMRRLKGYIKTKK